MSDDFDNQNFWSNVWGKHIENYLSAPPRTGIWLKSRFNLVGKDILECAGGSCRDACYLHSQGILSVGSDFDEKTCTYLAKKFIDSDFPIKCEDAFKFTFTDKSFDLVFHNGFWGYFGDEDIFKLLMEQARITKKILVAIVHNQKNKRLVKIFQEKAKIDSLYDIRFFCREEIQTIIKNSCVSYKKMHIEKFGGSVDFMYAIERKIPALKQIVRWLVPRLYRFQPWSKVERIALIIELE